MKKIYLTILVVVACFGVKAQTGFHKYFSQEFSDGNLYRCIQTSDGGVVAVGRFADETFIDDFIIMKTDAAGNPLWIKQISGSDADGFTDITELPGGDLVAAGTSVNMSTFMQTAVVIKFDASGNRLWNKSYTIGGTSSGASKVQTDPSGNIYVLGTVDVTGSFSDYFIMKLSPAGAILQQATFGTPDSDFPLSFLRMANGDFIIGGWDNAGNGENIHLVRVSSSMTVTWSKLMSGTIRYFSYDMREKSNGNVVLAGRYDDGVNPYGMLILELDPATGTPAWAKSYTTLDGMPSYAYGLTVQTGDLLAITGVVEDMTQGTLIAGLDPSGVVAWSERIGAPADDYGIGYGINKASDGGYFVCGPRGGGNNSTVQILKTTSGGGVSCYSTPYMLTGSAVVVPVQDLVVASGSGSLVSQDMSYTETVFTQLEDVCTSSGTAEVATGSRVSVFPNPSPGKFEVTFPAGMMEAAVTITGAAGNIVYSAKYVPEKNLHEGGRLEIDLEGKKGIFVLRIDDGNTQYTGKIMIR